MHANDIFLHMPSSNFYINKAYKINKNKIWGMGPKTGFHSKYNFYSNASFLFNLSTALLLTSHKESFKTTTYNIFNISTLTTSLNSKKQLLIQPLFNLALGVNYMTLFDKDNSKIDFNLLYETNFLFYKNYNIYSYGATFSVLLSF